MSATFNATDELQQIREIITVGKRKKYRKRKLDKYHAEVFLLRSSGATLAEIKHWLRIRKKLKVARSTIHRFLKDNNFQGMGANA